METGTPKEKSRGRIGRVVQLLTTLSKTGTSPGKGYTAEELAKLARGKPLATGRIWFARAVMVQIPEDHQIMIEIVALLGQQSVVAAK